MNKILALFEIEFKKIQKIYFAILSMLFLSNIAVFSFMIYAIVKNIEEEMKVVGGLDLLKESKGIELFLQSDNIKLIYILSFLLMVGALLWCLYYGFAIWYKDFSNKSKPIYTLFMLPENRFIIYISKLITMVTLIYGVIFVQFLCWIIDSLVVNYLTGISFEHIINIINLSNLYGYSKLIPAMARVEFVMFYVLGPILAMVVLFTGIMIHKSSKKIGGIRGVIYIVSIILLYFSLTIANNTYIDELFKTHMIFYIVVFVASIFISYNLLNKKIYD